MWTTVIIVGLVIAMLVGPIMLIQPSRRQRRLAKLRSAAAVHGLGVRLMRMPEGSALAGQEVALYYHQWPNNKSLKQTWLLSRQSYSHGLHFAENWDWANERPASPGWQEAIRRALPALPESVVGVEAASQSLGLCWLEQTGGKSVDEATAEISSYLKNLMAELQKRF
jgi:hypothetical protein